MGTQILSRADSLLGGLCCTDVQYQMPAGQCKPELSLLRSGELWSLWDMLQLEAEKFLKLMQSLNQLAGILLPVDGEPEITLTINEWIHKDANDVRAMAEALGLRMTVREADRLIHFF